METTIPAVPIAPPTADVPTQAATTMPVIGMGTASFPAPTDPNTTKVAVLEAIMAGYRHFDTALMYGSEKALGEAISEALSKGLIKSRDELFITSKLWCTFAERDLAVSAIKMSLMNLQLEYLDLYLIHFPLKLSPEARQPPIPNEYISPIDVKSAWEGMEECHRLGLAKAIGVSNFSSKKLEQILQIAKIPPAVNQVEMNPMWQQKELREYCKKKGIHVTAYSPLGANNTKWGDNRILDCQLLKEIADAKAKTVAQVSLRWVYEQGVSVVTKSFNKNRMKENLQIFDWKLTEDELIKISKLPQRKGVLLSQILGPNELLMEIDAEM